MDFRENLAQHQIFEIISQTAQQLQLESYVVGGFVRDLILKRNSKDIDIVCVGSGIALAQAVAQKVGKTKALSMFKNFGTAMLPFQGCEIEFVGARKESYRADSRKPIVEDGTLQDDQRRRDFTINAFAISLNPHNYGQLIDPFNGLDDIRKKIIRTPLEPKITFSDDPLRIMRAIRFASQLQFDIAPDTFDAILEVRHRLSIISQERITDEFNKIILSALPSYGFKLLDAAKILEMIFPEFMLLKGVENVEGKAHKDNFYHTLKVLDNISQVSDNLWWRWAAILHDIAKPQTKRFDKKVGWTFHGHEEKGARMVPEIFKRLKLPLNEKMRFVQKLVRLHLRPIALVKDSVTDSAIRRLLFDAGEDIEALMALCRADITSKDLKKIQKYIENFDRVEQKMLEIEQKDQLRNFQPVITGEIIMQNFALRPGKEVGELKSRIREAILDGIISNQYEQAFAFMLEEAHKMGLQRIQPPN